MKSLRTDISQPPLLLAIHGFTGDAYDFSALYEDPSLQAVWRFVDLPGHFRYGADLPGIEEQWIDFVSRLDQVMREAEAKKTKIYVLAYSMGVRLFLKALLESSWKPAGLILVGATAGVELIAERAERLKHDRALADKLRQGRIDSFIDNWMQQPIIATQHDVGSPERIQRKKQLNSKALADALVEYSPGNLPPIWDRLGEVKYKTWLIAGENDRKYLNLHQRMITLLPDADMRVISQAGHAPHIEQPEAFRDVLVSFLE